ncbi:hypothetical protein BJ742DRAFT_814576 [Cladochytrium replicatum]|nr:hypothetical protein BJ742DRAFT_814576 [Cladochytrium replicatum]
MAHLLTSFHTQMVGDLLAVSSPSHKPASSSTSRPALSAIPSGDGLLIIARGLGLRQVLVTLLQIHTDPYNLVLLLNASAREVELLREDLVIAAAALGNDTPDDVDRIHPDLLRVINNETPANERSKLYLSGGVLSVTSRILVVDMLNEVVPVDKITGIMVNHAHRVTETSTEAFILRLFRDKNKVGFIKAFSDQAEAFAAGGIRKLERTMKLLFQRKVYLWPRFQVTVSDVIQKQRDPVDVIELHVQLTAHMRSIQAALLECMESCVADLRRANPSIELDDFTLENSLHKSFDVIVRIQLDSIWHRVSARTRQLVSDIKTLRRLLSYLITYDSVTFNSFLETILTSNVAMANSSTAIFRGADWGQQSPWLLMDAAHTIFSLARQRVYLRSTTSKEKVVDGLPTGVHPVLEELPKWKALRDLLREIEAERKAMLDSGEVPGAVLIMTEGDRTCGQIRELLEGMDLTYVKPDVEEVAPSSVPSKKPKNRSRGKRKRDIKEEEEQPRDTEMFDDTTSTVPAENAGDVGDSSTSSSTTPTESKFSSPGAEAMMMRLLRNYFRWKGRLTQVTKNFASGKKKWGSADRGGRGGSAGSVGVGRGDGRGAAAGAVRGNAPANKRRRQRGGSSAGARGAADLGNSAAAIGVVDSDDVPISFEDEAMDIANFLNSHALDEEEGFQNDVQHAVSTTGRFLDRECYEVVDQSLTTVVRSYALTSSYAATFAGGGVTGDEDSRLLEELMPNWIIMYDPDLGFVRRVEVWRAAHQSHGHTRLYFMSYKNSVEEQRYLSSVRKEKEAFEKLIHEKANMAIPLDQDGRADIDVDDAFWRGLNTRLAGGQVIPASESNKVIVDVREFRSSLPQLLHTRHLKIRPCTLEVGDYVLSPLICVERKSVSDLVGSLKSGRLYTQSEAMCVHYKFPLLLIEFSGGEDIGATSRVPFAGGLQGFSDVAVKGGGGGSSGGGGTMMDVSSRLVLLCLTFPKLKVIWSVGPQATAEIFEDLKKNQDEPDMEATMAVGVEKKDDLDSAYSITPQDMLRSVRGITSRNYRFVMSKVRNMAELAQMDRKSCIELLGEENGRHMFEFFRADAKDDGAEEALRLESAGEVTGGGWFVP